MRKRYERDRLANTKKSTQHSTLRSWRKDARGWEEKIKNVNAALASASPIVPAGALAESLHKASGLVKDDALRHCLGAALRILNS